MADTALTAGQLFKAGKLAEAVDAANQAVRKSPTDLAARIQLAEMLVFAGNLDRADLILDAAQQIDPESMVVVAEFRQLIRAEQARRQLKRDGRIPEFIGEATPALTALLAGIVAERAGDTAEAARCAAEAETLRPRVPGFAGDTEIDDFRDADDLCAGVMEVLTTTGKYFWIPTERISSIEFHAPERPRDLIWRRVTMSVVSGPDGVVYLPVLYTSEDAALDPALKLGRETDWVGEAPVRGLGQRVFLAGEEAISIMDMTTLEFTVAAEPMADA